MAFNRKLLKAEIELKLLCNKCDELFGTSDDWCEHRSKGSCLSEEPFKCRRCKVEDPPKFPHKILPRRPHRCLSPKTGKDQEMNPPI